MWISRFLRTPKCSISISLQNSDSFDEAEARDKNILQINAEAEQWKQVQEVLKNVSVEMATVQQACLRWEKRALDAEHLATARQREVTVQIIRLKLRGMCKSFQPLTPFTMVIKDSDYTEVRIGLLG